MELSDYQRVTVKRLLDNRRYGVFDEMGVGKTAPTIVAAGETGEQTLVTAPAYLLENWEREIRMWLPNATIARAFGDREGERTRRQALFESSPADFILTPYNSWHSYPVLLKRRWGNLVFDEAHRLRSQTSKWTKHVYQTQNVGMKNRGSRFWFLTGTPLVRDGGDVYPFLHLMDRQLFSSYWTFVERWCHLSRNPWFTEVGDVLDPVGFVQMMARYSIRRLQIQIPELASLETIDQDIWVDLPPSVVEMIRRAKKEYVIRHPDLPDDLYYDGPGGLLQKLRELATIPPTQSKPKLTAFKDFLEDVPNERVVVFVWHRSIAEAVAQVAEKTKRPVQVITGDVRARYRVAAVDAYDNDPRTVLIGTIGAMKEGLNLQAGRHCVFLEESALPSDNEQAIGRLKRRGQTRPVLVTRIMANNSLDVVTHKNVGKRADSIRKALREFVRSA